MLDCNSWNHLTMLIPRLVYKEISSDSKIKLPTNYLLSYTYIISVCKQMTDVQLNFLCFIATHDTI